MKDWRVSRPPKRPVDSSLYKELSAPYCVAGLVHRAGLGSDGMFLALPLPEERQSNLDAIRGPPWDRFGSHMLLSFQRPPAPLERGLRSSDAPAAFWAGGSGQDPRV